jgi:asparagine N-glycosylation enzyme membrane subunit Stt3
MEKREIMNFLKDRRIQVIATIILLFVILFMSSSIRLSNLELLKDQTTGKYIPLALDPFYFLRVSETIVDQGGLPEFDALRFYPGGNVEWHAEIMPRVIVWMYKISAPVFGGSLQYYNVISPVIFYIGGLIIFFILALLLIKKKFPALLAAAFLAFSPAYLYRTMAGFSDHESIGMLAFFVFLLVYLVGLMKLDKDRSSFKEIIGWGIATGLASGMTIAAWGGIANFIFMIFPLGFFFIWLFHMRKLNENFAAKSISFYVLWIISSFIPSMFGWGVSVINYLLSTSGIVSLAILGFVIIDFAILKIRPKFVESSKRILYSLGGTIIIGILLLPLIGKNFFSLIQSIALQFLTPWNMDRLNLTVAENARPYLLDWISNMGATIFWLFIAGIVLFGFRLGRNIKNTKKKVMFIFLYLAMTLGIVFSRISAAHLLNGENFISGIIYFIPLVAFWAYFFYLYIKEDFSFDATEILIFVWMFFTIISGRATQRMFFALTPFVCLLGAYFVQGLFDEWKTSKDEILKILFIAGLIVAVIFSASAINQSYEGISSAASFTGPSANVHWQNAMGWVRNNTPEDSVFVHWWDYGYWVQSLGERTTVADGGHFEGAYNGDHKIGRYVLTTPHPETALSFFKTMETDYLLIDQTDLGKYGAYSKIGGDENWDSFSTIPVGVSDPKEIQETANGSAYLYRTPGIVDEDILYDSDNGQIFLPGPTFNKAGQAGYKSNIGGIVIEIRSDEITQPRAIFIYNGNQYRIPVRYIYINDELLDFGSGIDAVVQIVPSFDGASINPLGAAIYLSPKVSKSLFAQLYLMNDAFGNYPTIKLVHEEDDPYLVKQMRLQDPRVGEFVFYNGLRGPIKIWDTSDIPEEIRVVKEFYELQTENIYGALDELKFTN